MNTLFSGALKAATNIAQEQKNGLIGNIKTMATDAIQKGEIPTNPIGNLVGNQMNQLQSQMGNINPAIVPAPNFQPIPMPLPLQQMPPPPPPAIPSPVPLAPPPPPVVSSPAPSAPPVDDIISKMQHNIFSEEEVNILKLMHLNHLQKDAGEDVVNNKILGVMEKAISNQLTTETAKQTVQQIILQNLPPLMSTIVHFNGNSLAEILFRATSSTSSFRAYLSQTLEEYAISKRPFQPAEFTNKLVEKILATATSPTSKINQTGSGLGVTYPFRKNNVTRSRPRKRVNIL